MADSSLSLSRIFELEIRLCLLISLKLNGGAFRRLEQINVWVGFVKREKEEESRAITPPLIERLLNPLFRVGCLSKFRESAALSLSTPAGLCLSLGWLSSHFHARPREYECINMRANAILAKEYLYL